MEDCRLCNGCGFIEDDEAPGQLLLCPHCYGEGQVEDELEEGNAYEVKRVCVLEKQRGSGPEPDPHTQEGVMQKGLIVPMETAFNCNDDSSYKKGKSNGEQLFTLRAQDITTPECIAYWILKNIETAPEEKLRHALDDALRARKWPRRKRAD